LRMRFLAITWRGLFGRSSPIELWSPKRVRVFPPSHTTSDDSVSCSPPDDESQECSLWSQHIALRGFGLVQRSRLPWCRRMSEIQKRSAVQLFPAKGTPLFG